MFKIDAADYMMSICGNDALRELSSPGKSGSVFFLSQDDHFMIKTLRKSEVKVCHLYWILCIYICQLWINYILRRICFFIFLFLNFGEACSQEHFSQSLCTRVLQKLHSAKRFFPPLFKNFGGACSGSPFFSWKLTKREVY